MKEFELVVKFKGDDDIYEAAIKALKIAAHFHNVEFDIDVNETEDDDHPSLTLEERNEGFSRHISTDASDYGPRL